VQVACAAAKVIVARRSRHNAPSLKNQFRIQVRQAGRYFKYDADRLSRLVKAKKK
jgi:hypothetical protein